MNWRTDSIIRISIPLTCVLSVGCGGQVGNDAALAGNGATPNVQGVGGAQQGTGGASSATGGSSELPPRQYCNGLLGPNCPYTSFGDERDLNILFVIDESTSMNDPVAAGASASKWSVLKQAVASVLAGTWIDITGLHSSVNWALELFPYDPSGLDPNSQDPSILCRMPGEQTPLTVDFTPGVENTPNLINKLEAQTPAGGAPIAQALRQAYSYFTQGNGKSRGGGGFVILITDGGPNCNSSLTCNASTCLPDMLSQSSGAATNSCVGAGYNCLDDVAVVSEIDQLALVGTQTAVIGLPGSEPFANSLVRFALAGKDPAPMKDGSQGYYSVSATNSVQALTDTLKTILETRLPQMLKTCDIPLSQSPTDPANVQVVLDCGLVPQLPNVVSDAGDGDGYLIDYSKNPAHLVLMGKPCDQATAWGLPKLEVVIGCNGSSN